MLGAVDARWAHSAHPLTDAGSPAACRCVGGNVTGMAAEASNANRLLTASLFDAAAAVGGDALWAHCYATVEGLDPHTVVDALAGVEGLAKLTVPHAEQVLCRWSETSRRDLVADAAARDTRISVREFAGRLAANPRTMPSLAGSWGRTGTVAELVDRVANLKPRPGHDKYPGAVAVELTRLHRPAEVVADVVVALIDGSDARFGCFTVEGTSPQRCAEALVDLFDPLPHLVLQHVVNRLRGSDMGVLAPAVVALCGHGRLPRSQLGYGFTYQELRSAAEYAVKVNPAMWPSGPPSGTNRPGHDTAALLRNLASVAITEGVPVFGARSAAALVGAEDLSAAADRAVASLVEVLCAHRLPVELGVVLRTATADGARLRPCVNLDLSVVPNDVPVRVVAAALAPRDPWFKENQFVDAVCGMYNHRWDPADVLEVLEAHPQLGSVVAFGVLNSRNRLRSWADPAPRELVAFSMRRLGLHAWVEACDRTAAELAQHLADAHIDTVITAMSLLRSGFAGTPAELVEVAEAASPSGSVPSGSATPDVG